MARSPKAFPELVTKRLRLRRLEQRDLDGLHACIGDPIAMRYWDRPVSENPAATAKALQWMSKSSSPYTYLVWAVARKTDDTCIGMVNYHNREARQGRLDVGYVIAPKHQRHGYGREALGALVAYCFETLDVHRVQALIQPENATSIALVESLGFRLEGGPLLDHVLVGDRYASVMVYAHVKGRR